MSTTGLCPIPSLGHNLSTLPWACFPPFYMSRRNIFQVSLFLLPLVVNPSQHHFSLPHSVTQSQRSWHSIVDALVHGCFSYHTPSHILLGSTFHRVLDHGHHPTKLLATVRKVDSAPGPNSRSWTKDCSSVWHCFHYDHWVDPSEGLYSFWGFCLSLDPPLNLLHLWQSRLFLNLSLQTFCCSSWPVPFQVMF